MSDTALNKIIQYGTRAARTAFTPSPASGSQVLYLWYETDHAPDVWAWDGSAWQQINTGGSGTVTNTGTLTAGQIIQGNGSADITVGDLSGDVTTSGGLATTIANGAVTLAKITNASASSKLLGSGASGSGSPYAELSLGTNLSMSGTTLNAASSGSLVLLQSVTASASATIDLTAFSSTYDSYLVVLENILAATSATTLLGRFGTGAGPTWDSGSNYTWAAFASNQAHGTGATGAAADTSFQFLSSLANTSTDGVSGTLTLTNVNSASAQKLATFQVAGNQSSGNFSQLTGSVQYLSTSAITGLRLLMASGNIASGTVYLYGYKKS